MLYELGHLFSPQVHYNIYTKVSYTVASNRASNKARMKQVQEGTENDLYCCTATECCGIILLHCVKIIHCDWFN